MAIETEMIAASAMCWLRFGKQHSYVARECGYYAADVLSTNMKTIVEVEVKVSARDLLADKKKYKHEYYSGKRKETTRRTAVYNIPHQFYYAVPEGLKDAALEFAKELNPKYGVLIFRDISVAGFPEWRVWERLKCVRRAAKLHKNSVSEAVRDMIAARMASDLCRMHLNRQMHKDYVTLAREVSREVEKHPKIEKSEKLRK